MEEKTVELNQNLKYLKSKIVEAYLYFALEKDLFQELISYQLEFSRLIKQKMPVVKEKEKLSNIYNEMKSRLEEKSMEEVEIVLNDCIELVNIEWELVQSEEEIKVKKFFFRELEKKFTVNIISQQVWRSNFTFQAQFGNRAKLIDYNQKLNSDWTNIHYSFTKSLINYWTDNHFTYQQTQEWINIGFSVQDAEFCAWLRDNKQLVAEECLNYGNLNQLRNEYWKATKKSLAKDTTKRKSKKIVSEALIHQSHKENTTEITTQINFINHRLIEQTDQVTQLQYSEKQPKNLFLEKLSFLQSQLTKKESEIINLKQSIQVKPHLTNILGNSIFNVQGSGFFGNTQIGNNANFSTNYNYILQINTNEELIKVKEQETNSLKSAKEQSIQEKEQEITSLQTQINQLESKFTISKMKKMELEQQLVKVQADKNELIIDFEQKIKLAEKEINRLGKENQELIKKIVICKRLFSDLLTKKESLEKLKVNYLEKGKNYKKIEEKLSSLLKIKKIMTNSNEEQTILLFNEQIEEIINKLTKKTKLTSEGLNNFCLLQAEITKLENQLQSIKETTESRNIGETFNIIKKAPLTKEQAVQTDQEEQEIKTEKPKEINRKRVMPDEFKTRATLNHSNWINIHCNFTLTLISRWTNQNFTYQQCKEWIDIILPNQQPTEIHQVEFYAWLRDSKHLTAEECLNYHNLNQLKNEYQTQLLQAQIQIPPKN